VPQGVEVQVLSSAPLFIRGWSKKVALLTTTLLGNRLMLKTTEGHKTRRKTYSKKLKTMLRRTGTKIKKRGLINRVNIAVFVVLFAGIGGYFVINSFAASTPTAPGNANIWVSPTGSSTVGTGTNCQRGAAAAYDPNKDCSWAAAYAAASNNDVVNVIAGDYGTGNITFLPKSDKSTPTVKYYVSGGTAQIGDVFDVPSNTTLNGPVIASALDAGGASNVTVDGWEINGKYDVQQILNFVGSPGFTFRNGTVHAAFAAGNTGSMAIGGGSGITIENTDFYDALMQSNDGVHTECLYMTGASNVVLRGNHFWSCSTEDVFITDWYGAGLDVTATNWLVENNIFEKPGGPNGNAFAFRTDKPPYDVTPDPDGFIFRYNTFGPGANMQWTSTSNPVTANGFQLYGNYAPGGLGACNDPNADCSNNRTSTATGFVNAVQPNGDGVGRGAGHSDVEGDFHLSSTSSPLVDAGTTNLPFALLESGCAAPNPCFLKTKAPTAYPSTDKDGNNRFARTAPDIGAYEFGSTSSGGGSGPTANLWVNVTAGASPSRCDVACAYNSTNAYGSIQEALAACDGTKSDVIRVVAGNYGKMTLSAQKTAPGCSVIGDTSGTGVNATGITPIGSYFTLKNIKNSGALSWENPPDGNAPAGFPHDLVFDNVTANAKMFIRGGKNITWKNSIIGPFYWHNDGALDIEGADPGYLVDNFVIDNLTFKDVQWDKADPNGTPDLSAHTEVIRLDDNVSNVTIKNSKFINNLVSTAVIFTGSKGSLGSVNGLTLKNNYIGQPYSGDQQSGLDAANGCRNLKILYNTWSNRTMSMYDCTASTTNVTIVGNLGDGHCKSAPSGATINYSYNFWTNIPACGTSDKGTTATDSQGKPVPIVIPHASDGYHLVSSSQAIRSATDITNLKAQATCSNADPNLDVSTDIDGDTRPQGAGCDAGADEYASGTTPTCTKSGDINCDNSVNVTDLSILLSNYGKTTAQLASSTPSYPKADINTSGKVDIADLSALLTGYGK
jgi:hypothetical protein